MRTLDLQGVLFGGNLTGAVGLMGQRWNLMGFKMIRLRECSIESIHDVINFREVGHYWCLSIQATHLTESALEAAA